jgi:hypothetical protein
MGRRRSERGGVVICPEGCTCLLCQLAMPRELGVRTRFSAEPVDLGHHRQAARVDPEQRIARPLLNSRAYSESKMCRKKPRER